MRPRSPKHVRCWTYALSLALGPLLAACTAEEHHEQIERQPKAEPQKQVQSRDPFAETVPGDIVGQDPLFRWGTLYKVSTYDLMPREAVHDLWADWWGKDWGKYVSPLWSPHRHEYDLIYQDCCRKAWITQIVDLRWKVEVLSEEQASQFADLTGAVPTAIFFRDARGLEVRAYDCWEAPVPYCMVTHADFEKLGLKGRRIEQVATGFIIRRPLYQPNRADKPAKLVESREFVSADGLYIFGIDREVLEGKECSVVVDGRSNHDLEATHHYQALFDTSDGR